MKNRASGFTLAELLAVVTIMAILLAMAVPAFIGLSKGSNMNTSISELRATLMQARQWAITHREATYIVLPPISPFTVYAGNHEHVEKACRAYGAYTRSEGYIGDWHYLQPGIFFIPNDRFDPHPTNVVHNAESPFALPTNTAMINFPTSNDSPKRIPVIMFKPDGTLNTFGSIGTKELFRGEGIRTVDYSSGTIDQFVFQQNSPVFGLQMTPLTGLVSVKDYQPLAPP